ncbi:MAG: histidine triad nucleotide-binding protein [Candidatus Spechtbacteria bacterium SB0662_bin_43]|uniref:Histidine triad nucleotide-binding protein n=1 Tax=Candidatus Spechtbacteria bacterium SB0662_bin_43 TaxID=2604897 RepID=A0A845DCJ2_9BACT|nr:histidine triad nucleotide-binding protein [Candidatus Spechtbacteria bacterium SB0662_bin_43]
MEKDVFCSIIAGDIPSTRLQEDNSFVAIKDIHPKAQHHYLIIPKKHIESIDDVENSDRDLMGDMVLFAQQCAKTLNLEGYKLLVNVGEKGGQEVPHIHLHLLGGEFYR